MLDDVAFQIQNIWNQKRAIVREILGEACLLREATPALSYDRTRLDLMLYKNKIGMRGPKKSNDPWDFDFFEELPEWSLDARLLESILELKKNVPPIEGSQLRFRVAPDSKKGIWFDTSREILQKLKDEHKNYIDGLKEAGWIVELGQKDEQSEAHEWLPSFSKDNDEIPLKFFVSNFSQPGPEANRALIALGVELLESAQGVESWLEVGAGYGNLSAAFKTLYGCPLALVETDAKAERALEMNKLLVADESTRILKTSVEAFSGESRKCDLLVADPPRSGFSEFFKKDSIHSKYLLLYSCDLKGLIADCDALKRKYKLAKWAVADIFPGTPFVEVVSLWERHT